MQSLMAMSKKQAKSKVPGKLFDQIVYKAWFYQNVFKYDRNKNFYVRVYVVKDGDVEKACL